jgi:hypothetical protein
MVHELIYRIFLIFRRNIGTTLFRKKKQFYELLFILDTEVINLKILVVIQQRLYMLFCGLT